VSRYEDVNITAPPKAERPVENKPMRAGQFTLNADVLVFLKDAIDLLGGTDMSDPIWDDDVADRAPQLILAELEKAGWTRYQDKYGDHAYTTTTYPASNPPRSTDVLRINVVSVKGVLKLDIRPWGQY